MRLKLFTTGATMLLLFITSAKAQQVVKYLDENEKVVNYPKVEWLKGAPVEQFDKDKIYVIELWATWCKPCIAAMPHLSKLNAKFGDKIVFIGQNVMEDDPQKVKQFITDNAALMNYRLAYGGMKESDFYLNWLKPSGTFAIPRTFVIQNNTIVWMTNPMALNEEVLQLLLDKKFSIAEAKKLKK